VAITAAETVDPTSRCRYFEEPVSVGTVGRITSVAGVPRMALADAGTCSRLHGARKIS